ncbi:hypothetical protein SAMN05421747_106152 [Parapedobacter composti]|uniref:Lipocalin-like domain-containing protein n=1 Tax=Parapedobacter composti TaxID=623281 RepID=A0A1I1HKC3_9SPHI|nr:hypothetical protein [Parapedobacter composti]SFC22408.1 hypothetical protein SAMN05421747_106152 [Parapedobacter composti]
MKNVIHFLLWGSLVLLGACKKDGDADDDGGRHQTEDSRLVGKWQNESGTTIYNGRADGLMLESTTNSAWLETIQTGFVKYGDFYIKNLNRESENRFSCEALWYTRVNGTISGVRYSSESTLTISQDGNQLELDSYSPYDGQRATSILIKR